MKKFTESQSFNIAIIVFLALITIMWSIPYAMSYKAQQELNKTLKDTIICDVYKAINLKENTAETVIIDTTVNIYKAFDTVQVHNITSIVSNSLVSKNWDVFYHKDMLGVHLGIAKALRNGNILHIYYDDINVGEDQ